MRYIYIYIYIAQYRRKKEFSQMNHVNLGRLRKLVEIYANCNLNKHMDEDECRKIMALMKNQTHTAKVFSRLFGRCTEDKKGSRAKIVALAMIYLCYEQVRIVISAFLPAVLAPLCADYISDEIGFPIVTDFMEQDHIRNLINLQLLPEKHRIVQLRRLQSTFNRFNMPVGATCGNTKHSKWLLLPPHDRKDGQPDDHKDGPPDGPPDGQPDDSKDGQPDGQPDDRKDGQPDGRPDDSKDGQPDDSKDGDVEQNKIRSSRKWRRKNKKNANMWKRTA